MEFLNDLLSFNPDLIVIVLMVIFYTLEQVLNNPFTFSNRPGHLFHNALFQVVFIAGNILWSVFTVYCIEWLNENRVGLFYLIGMPVWLKLVMGVAMIDLVTYWFHRFSHVVPVLWRFHRVHHSDTSMDSSTYFRSHPVELLLWFGSATILASAIFGLDLMAAGLYFLVVTPFFFLQHANLQFPVWLDKSVGWLFTTPNLHKVHHEQDQYYTDSNYADIFIIWDRIFGTYRYKPLEKIKYGLKEFDDKRKQTFWYLMISPFININRVSSGEPVKTTEATSSNEVST